NTARLYRYTMRDQRHVYSKDRPTSSRLPSVEHTALDAHLWTKPGEGRIGLYCSTFVDGTDVYLEAGLQNVEKYSADTKSELGVDRLRPTLEPLYYVYP